MFFSWVELSVMFQVSLVIMFQVSRPGKRYNLTINGCVKILGTGWKACQILNCFEKIMYYVATFLSIFGNLFLKVFPPMACPPMITNFHFCLLPSNQMCFFLISSILLWPQKLLPVGPIQCQKWILNVIKSCKTIFIKSKK